jgi:hypothetical protein
MRQLFQSQRGVRMYVFTTFGQTYEGVFNQLLDDVVELIAVDGRTRMNVQLTDISGVRIYEEETDEQPVVNIQPTTIFVPKL